VLSWSPPPIWVDARSDDRFAAGHVTAAVSVNEDAWDEGLGRFLQIWQPGAKIVVYCDGADCQASELVAQRLRRELDLEDVYVLAGGFEAWKRRNPS
jgi:rhodanese-related sulfurtransferase